MNVKGQEEALLDVKIAEAPRLYKFYLNQEKKILGTISVALFLVVWELVGNTFQLINPMFMSAPSLVWKAGVQLFGRRDLE
jgi:ABC-type nitrate/sulfonate/bicarbonate transport system permease component